MADKEVKKPGFFKGVKREFKKIYWPNKDDLVKETTAVVICSVIIGAIISVVDSIVMALINLIVKK